MLTDEQLALRLRADRPILPHGTRLYFILIVHIGESHNVVKAEDKMEEYVATIDTDDLFYLVFGGQNSYIARRELAKRIARDRNIDYMRLYAVDRELGSDRERLGQIIVHHVLREAYLAGREDIYMPIYEENSDNEDLPVIVLLASPVEEQIIKACTRSDLLLQLFSEGVSFERLMYLSEVVPNLFQEQYRPKLSHSADAKAALAIITRNFSGLDTQTMNIVDGQV